MIEVIHYANRDLPDIHYDMDDRSEEKLLKAVKKTHLVERCSAEEWYGQDRPNYAVHHWKATKK